jgi:phosphatidate cytidylyltransferase
MLKQRLIVAVILATIGIGMIFLGGWALTIFVIFLLGMAAWEYGQLFRQGEYQPATWLVITGVILSCLMRMFFGFNHSDLLLSSLTLLTMAWHVFAYERGSRSPGSDFSITLAGFVYIGWLGAYFISLRNLPDGTMWLLLVISAICFADSAAYILGRWLGKHKLSPRVSNGKTWEGYIGGILVGLVLTTALAAWIHLRVPAITWQIGLFLGAVLGILAPLGDLGESMLKRQFGVKDSSRLLLDHGGFLDRMDSWLWAAAIGYYLIIWQIG